MKDYEPDNFTENDVLACLETAGLKYKRGGRYILTQCPNPDHQDKNPSAQIYRDGWCNCHVCGRFHITKAFPELRRQGSSSWTSGSHKIPSKLPHKVEEMKYKTYDLMHEWEQLPKIPRDHKFKGIPLETLDDLGWRWDEYKNSYFIPYFNTSRTQIPFGQWRHLSGERRFTFLPEAKPVMYGLWNLNNSMLFLCEGASDAAVMDYCGVPWIAAPSASSGELVGRLARYCKENDITLIFAGDNDTAGLKLRQAIDDVVSYRVCQAPKKYKDYGEFFESEGHQSVQNYCFKELFPQEYPSTPEEAKTALEKVQDIFPGAVELTVVDPKETVRKEPIDNVGSTILF